MISKAVSDKGTDLIKANRDATTPTSELGYENGRANTVYLSENGKVMTLTVEDLTQAIRTSIDSSGMPEEQARMMAQHVMNFFGYSERIIDNILEPEDRDAFYMLEDTGILTTEREETTLYDGREWRIHYWLFRKERIFELISGNGRGSGLASGDDSIYDEVPEDVWQRAA